MLAVIWAGLGVGMSVSWGQGLPRTGFKMLVHLDSGKEGKSQLFLSHLWGWYLWSACLNKAGSAGDPVRHPGSVGTPGKHSLSVWFWEEREGHTGGTIKTSEGPVWGCDNLGNVQREEEVVLLGPEANLGLRSWERGRGSRNQSSDGQADAHSTRGEFQTCSLTQDDTNCPQNMKRKSFTLITISSPVWKCNTRTYQPRLSSALIHQGGRWELWTPLV